MAPISVQGVAHQKAGSSLSLLAETGSPWEAGELQFPGVTFYLLSRPPLGQAVSPSKVTPLASAAPCN